MIVNALNIIKGWAMVVIGFTSLAAAFATPFVVFNGFAKLEVSEYEEDWVRICDLPRHVLYEYIKVGRTNYNGDIVKSHWLAANVYNDPARAAEILEWAKEWRDDKYYNEIIKSISNNYNLEKEISPEDSADIGVVIKQVKHECPNITRRTEFNERFYDFLQQIGLSTILIVYFFLGYYFMNKFKNS